MKRVQRESFNPKEYESSMTDESDYESNSYESDYFDTEDDNIVSQGDSRAFKIDVQKFENICDKFRKNPNLRIDKLEGNDKDDYDLIKSYVELLYDTEYYKYLYAKVEEKFKDLEKIKPGTVGGYLAGCLINDNYRGAPGCSLTCAGSAPLPNNGQDNQTCNKAVIWAEYITENNQNYGFNFDILKQAESPEELDPVYLYITSQNKSFNNAHEFPGFSKSEKETLLNMGIKNIHLMSYTNECKYIDLYGRPIELKDVKMRGKSSNSNLGLAIVLILIFVLLIVLFFGWRLLKHKNKMF